MRILTLVALMLSLSGPASAKLLVPMDLTQNNHLKAYGLAFWSLTQGAPVEWFLNYRGGAFLIEDLDILRRRAVLMGVDTIDISSGEEASIRRKLESENMEAVLLEKAPRVAIYTPPGKQPWDDAGTRALTYAKVPYDLLVDLDCTNAV